MRKRGAYVKGAGKEVRKCSGGRKSQRRITGKKGNNVFEELQDLNYEGKRGGGGGRKGGKP